MIDYKYILLLNDERQHKLAPKLTLFLQKKKRQGLHHRQVYILKHKS